MKSMLFSPGMAVEAAAGRKTKTRRVVKPQPGGRKFGGRILCSTDPAHDGCAFFYRGESPVLSHDTLYIKSPYGEPGDHVRMLTTWATSQEYDHLKPTELPDNVAIWSYFDTAEKPYGFTLVSKKYGLGKSRPGRFLPNKLRHLMPMAKITSEWAERVQDITESEAIAEGITETPRDPGFDCWSTTGVREYYATPRGAFRALWDRINAKRGYPWEANDWVWVEGFKMAHR